MVNICIIVGVVGIIVIIVSTILICKKSKQSSSPPALLLGSPPEGSEKHKQLMELAQKLKEDPNCSPFTAKCCTDAGKIMGECCTLYPYVNCYGCCK
jgi:hypothetical protein